MNLMVDFVGRHGEKSYDRILTDEHTMNDLPSRIEIRVLMTGKKNEKFKEFTNYACNGLFLPRFTTYFVLVHRRYLLHSIIEVVQRFAADRCGRVGVTK